MQIIQKWDDKTHKRSELSIISQPSTNLSFFMFHFSPQSLIDGIKCGASVFRWKQYRKTCHYIAFEIGER